VVQAVHDAPVRQISHEGAHPAAVLPGADGPPCVVRVAERVRAEVTLRLRRLLDRGDRIGEELIQQRRIPQPEPGHYDDRHRSPPVFASSTATQDQHASQEGG